MMYLNDDDNHKYQWTLNVNPLCMGIYWSENKHVFSEKDYEKLVFKVCLENIRDSYAPEFLAGFVYLEILFEIPNAGAKHAPKLHESDPSIEGLSHFFVNAVKTILLPNLGKKLVGYNTCKKASKVGLIKLNIFSVK